MNVNQIYKEDIEASFKNQETPLFSGVGDYVVKANYGGIKATENFSVIDDKHSGVEKTTGEGNPNAELYNIWVSYETGALTLAAEYNDYENAGAAGNSGDSMMGLARYALNEKSSITGRYSEENLNDGRATEKWTIAPTYSFSDNLAGRIEYSRTEYTGVADMDEVELFAIEAMFTF